MDNKYLQKILGTTALFIFFLCGRVYTVYGFEEDVEVIKSGPDIATVGETITYEFTINNHSSADTPTLILDSVTDTVLGDLTTTANSNGCETLITDASCSFTYDYTIQDTDPSPLVNDVTATYHADGFPPRDGSSGEDTHSVEIVVASQGCSPGFWQGGDGSQLWDEVNDTDWTNAGAQGTNPYIHTTLFNSFFTPYAPLAGVTVFELVDSGGKSEQYKKAARSLVAAYLNESAFPNSFPAEDTSELATLWMGAVASDTFKALHLLLHDWNNPEFGSCPLPKVIPPPCFNPSDGFGSGGIEAYTTPCLEQGLCTPSTVCTDTNDIPTTCQSCYDSGFGCSLCETDLMNYCSNLCL